MWFVAKRFTDTGKWKMAWFRELSPKLKAVNDFLCDNCDHAGIWDIDLEGLKFYVNEKNAKGVLQPISMDEIRQAFQGKVSFIDDDKLFLEPFVLFQYKLNSLSELRIGNTVHKSIIERLEKYKIIAVEFIESENSNFPKTNIIVLKGLPIPLVEGAKDKDKDIDKDMDKEKDTDKDSKALKFKVSDNDLELIYKSYPLKKGKHKGFEKAKREIVSAKELDDLRFAVNAYKADVERNKTKPEYIKHFSTFMSEWRDWLDPETGSSIVAASERADLGAIWNEGEGA